MKDKSQTLVILTPGFPKDETDSTCLPLQQSLLLTISRNYPTIQLLILSFQYPFTESTYTWNGIRVKSFGGKNKPGIQRWWLWRKIKAELRLIHEQNKITGILSFWCGECALLGSRFAAKHQLIHRCWILGQDAKATNKYVSRIKPDKNELIALSDFIAGEMEKNHGIRPFTIIPPGIDPGMFPSNGLEKTIDILGAGSLIPLKRFDLFVEVVADIRKEIPWLRVAICGEGPERKKLEEQISLLDLKETIILTGELPHIELLKLMQHTKIFLHTSSYEGFGMVCLEALYAKAKVISFVKPMNAAIHNWIIADTKEIMLKKIPGLLKTDTSYESVLPYKIKDCAQKIVGLFEQ
ncbi:MAG: glycosyltransferase family 4 protein [Chitinophagales bacterium]|nr:glycosyltransferase family 4 protein [Chitinophagales bacterium]